MMTRNKKFGAVFLDRDGVINEDRADYVKNSQELRIFDFAPEAISLITQAGLQVYVISNQQGIAKGEIKEENLIEIENKIRHNVEKSGGSISGFYYCKHLSTDNCECRKPKPGLIIKAAQEHNVSLADSVFVGDHERDMVAGRKAGCKTILVLTSGLTAEDAQNMQCKPDYIVNNLLEAAKLIIKMMRVD